MQTTLVGSAERTRLLDQAMAKVREYRSLPENWDSYGGKRASDKAVNYATSLLACLYNDPEVYAPFVSPISNGVHLEWKYGEKDLYFEIDQTSVLIVARDSGQIVCSAEDPGFDVASAIDVTKYFHQSVK